MTLPGRSARSSCHAALLHRFDLDVNPLATRAHGSTEYGGLVGQGSLQHSAR